jgi:hypothetical protein
VDERGFPTEVNGQVNVGAVSQAPRDSARLAVSRGAASSLAPADADALFAAGLSFAGRHRDPFLAG